LYAEFSQRRLEGRDHLEYLDVDGRIAHGMGVKNINLVPDEDQSRVLLKAVLNPTGFIKWKFFTAWVTTFLLKGNCI
jgi:hypothetical protein